MHKVSLRANDQLSPGVPVAEPEQQDPGHHRPRWPGWSSRWRCSSPAILIYLAEKTGQFPPRAGCALRDAAVAGCGRWGVGPMFGQLGFFHQSLPAATGRTSAARSLRVAESRRLLGVLEQRLAASEWIMGRRLHHCRHGGLFRGCATWWVFTMPAFLVGWADFPVQRALDAFVARPAAARAADSRLTTSRIPEGLHDRQRTAKKRHPACHI